LTLLLQPDQSNVLFTFPFVAGYWYRERHIALVKDCHLTRIKIVFDKTPR
jgi:hypothetical protein